MNTSYLLDFYFETTYKLERFNSEVSHQELQFEKVNLLNTILREVKKYVPEVAHNQISTGNLVLDYNVKTFSFKVEVLGHSFYFVGSRDVFGSFGEPSHYLYSIHSTNEDTFEDYQSLMNKEIEQAQKEGENARKKSLIEREEQEEYKRQLEELKRHESSKVFYLPSGEIDFLKTPMKVLKEKGLL